MGFGVSCVHSGSTVGARSEERGFDSDGIGLKRPRGPTALGRRSPEGGTVRATELAPVPNCL